MLNSLHWDTRLLVTFMHAWKHQISSSVLTAETFLLIYFTATEREPLFTKEQKHAAVLKDYYLPRK